MVNSKGNKGNWHGKVTMKGIGKNDVIAESFLLNWEEEEEEGNDQAAEMDN
jgi:hypothetical protein